MEKILKNLSIHINEHIERENLDYTSNIITRKVAKTNKGYQLLELKIEIKSTNYEALKTE